MKFKLSKEPLSIFAYSSLTDIVMLLLIFFLLTSHFVIQTGVKVKLPGSKMNERSQPSQMIVTLTAAGAVFAGEEEINIDQLSAKLNELKAKTNEDNLVIRADKTVSIDLVIKVIDAAKISNIEKFTIETEKENL
ncbi:MAG TPA: biopolymer transporter ExbD [Ignavibacteriaceae bacterium]|jgi:biopolymer transport protein ExbD|nr:MAG: Biopolymer transport protein ExbD [Ignavibacteria bacterium ADurb.Bin266]OQY75648.1 MAG: biopolymer transporter [Ignavibacteriales bacterium UTCHB2]HQF43744.1 biopolymer transporter ExbD [Ignavibacteriaceae bacterium]HQI40309.1 biopolymer transporter ExbD [Ignavibacteriaceae bacterium]HQJ47253.1 biopolymer transporter ExbD [Ignavibacteriaceae bacterium]